MQENFSFLTGTPNNEFADFRGGINQEIIAQQDADYEASLQIDREKEKERQKKEEIARIQYEKDQERIGSMLEKKEKIKNEKIARLPPEPSEGAPSTTLVIRLLDGSKVQRKFSPNDKLQAVFDFIEIKIPLQIEDESYEVTSNFPRKVFNDPNLTLQEANLVGSAMLTLSPN